MKKIAFLIFTFIISLVASSQILVNNTAPYNSPTHLVNNILAGNGVVASNITFSGQAAQIGFFRNGLLGSPNLGIDSGIVISSGDVNDIPPGGNQPNVGQYSGPGDNDLLTIAQSVTTNPQASQITSTQDAAALEFDFIPVGDTIEFRFVFASEEYTTYINTKYNDIFAFFLSGPGISGPYASPTGFPNGSINLAQVPNTTTPITISSIHPGLNSQYYISNTSETSHDFNGFTTVLTIKYAVQCGQLYHFKFAIADCQDDYLDTGVFIEAGSLASSGVSIQANTPLPNNTIIESCGDAEILIIRSDTTFNDTVNLVLSGNAIPSEYSNIPLTQIFAPGTDTIKFNVTAFADNLIEGTDTLIIEISGNTGCNKVTILINDYTSMSINVSDSINICSDVGETGQVWVNITDGLPPYSYQWNDGSFGDTLTVSPPHTFEYIPTVFDACGNSITGEIVPVWVQCEIKPINVFTPNGDGKNDYFTLFNLDDYPNASVKVFNRWGKLVYENENYQNDWDGGDLNAGTYYYIVFPNNKKYEYHKNKDGDLKYTIKGYVHLFR